MSTGEEQLRGMVGRDLHDGGEGGGEAYGEVKVWPQGKRSCGAWMRAHPDPQVKVSPPQVSHF